MKYFFLFLFITFSSAIGEAQTAGLKQIDSTKLVAKIKKQLDSSQEYYNRGDFAKSIKINNDLIALTIELDNPYYLSRNYRSLAYNFLVLNDTTLARQYFEKAKVNAELQNSNLALGKSYMDIANYYSQVDAEYSKVLDYHKKMIEQMSLVEDSTHLASAYYNTVLNTFEKGKYDDGFPYLKKLTDPAFKKLLPPVINASNHAFWSEYYLEKKQFKKAEKEALIVIDLVKDSDYIIELTKAYDFLSSSLAGQGRFNEAYENRVLYEEFNTQVLALKEADIIQASLAKFKTQQYLNEIEVQKEKAALQSQLVESKSFQNNLLIIVCIIILILFLALLAAFIKRRSLNNALREKNKEYLIAKEKSESLTKSKSKFFSTVSHELRTPLYGVIGLSTILLEDPNLKTHKKDLEALKFSADYLLALINDVLQINKIDSNNLDTSESEFNIRQFVQNMAATFEYMRLQNKNILTIDIDPKISENLEGNIVRLSQVLMNLIGNAFKFTKNGVITISLKRIDHPEHHINNIRFTVEDTGIGIPKEKQESLFDEFTQIGSVNHSYEGTGLGLPIVKKLLDASNSKINFKSELGKGTIITFDLIFKEVLGLIHKEPTIILNNDLLKNKNILIAEDNRINQIVTKKILEKMGVNCLIAQNGEETIDIIKNEKCDLILMDLNMPKLDGFEATKIIRKLNKEIPIIALTAIDLDQISDDIYLAGINDIIIKPYDIKEFTQKIIINIGKKG